MGNQNNSKYILVLIPLLFFLFLIPSIQAAPPSTTVVASSEGLIISFPHSPYLKLNNAGYIRFWVFNQTDGVLMSNSSVNCTFDLFDNSGKNIFKIMSPDIRYGSLGTQACASCFNINISGTNFSRIGYYPYLLFCSTNPAYPIKLGGTERDILEVTSTGASSDIGYFFIAFSLVYILLLIGIFTRNIPATILGGFAGILLGLYTLINGIDIYRNFLTEGISIITIAFSGFWAAKASLESLEEYNNL